MLEEKIEELTRAIGILTEVIQGKDSCRADALTEIDMVGALASEEPKKKATRKRKTKETLVDIAEAPEVTVDEVRFAAKALVDCDPDGQGGYDKVVEILAANGFRQFADVSPEKLPDIKAKLEQAVATWKA